LSFAFFIMYKFISLNQKYILIIGRDIYMDKKKEAISRDVDKIVKEAEKILRCSIFKLLEKVIEQESANGQLDFSAIPKNITDELKEIQYYISKCEAEEEQSHFGDLLHHQVIQTMEKQLQMTLELHHQSFHKLTASIDISSEFNFAYESFVRIAKKFIHDEITWYRIVSLLCFGAEIAVEVIKKGRPGVQSFVNKIVHYVVEFLLKEEVADWIAEHGGWVFIFVFLIRHPPKEVNGSFTV
jgi:Apoptosis regulator proteins, Bcl-2 family.